MKETTKGLIPYIEEQNDSYTTGNFTISDLDEALNSLNKSVEGMERPTGICRLSDEECESLPVKTLEGLLNTMEVWASCKGIEIIEKRVNFRR